MKLLLFLRLVLLFSAAAPTLAADDTALAERLVGAVARRGLDRTALGIAGHIVRHETPAPAFAEPLVRQILDRPAAALATSVLFEQMVPEPLRLLAAIPAVEAPAEGETDVRELVASYVADLVAARDLLHIAVPVQHAGLLGEQEPLPALDVLSKWAASLDARALARARDSFVAADARMLARLRAARDHLRFPATPERFESMIGTVIIGSPNDDVYAEGTALIIDPGGNDVYLHGAGAVAVVVDLAGNDRYLGNGLVACAHTAIFDLAGDDRYEAKSGLGAAIGGVSLLFDLSGDDDYRVGDFGLGAAAFGLGAVIDLAGNDSYEVGAGGQGFGMAAGVGLLWDIAGDDEYKAAGLVDPFARGGRISLAQGAAWGGRSFLGGGVGILRDDSGNDRYFADMFAQGAGYYYGVGLIWDRHGNDSYHAIRYAQGVGIHEAVGMLRDEGGDDGYELASGAGQGMGLDLAVGLLRDDAGHDRYAAGALAQGAATANGVGIAIDTAGSNRWQLGAGLSGWGSAVWARALPSLGLVLFDDGSSTFTHAGAPLLPGAAAVELASPVGQSAPAHEAAADPPCPAPPAPVTTMFDTARLGDERFEIANAQAAALRCALAAAPADAAQEVWNAIETVLTEDPVNAAAGGLATALRARPAPIAQQRRLLDRLDAHPRCSVRSLALLMRAELLLDDAPLAELATVALRALNSTCWREQAQARRALARHGIPVPKDPNRPPFVSH